MNVDELSACDVCRVLRAWKKPRALNGTASCWHLRGAASTKAADFLKARRQFNCTHTRLESPCCCGAGVPDTKSITLLFVSTHARWAPVASLRNAAEVLLNEPKFVPSAQVAVGL